MSKDDGELIADFVEEDTDAWDGGDGVGTICCSEPRCRVTGVELGSYEFGGANAVLGFRGPLLFFSVAPEYEDAGENEGEEKGEPCAGGNFDEGC